jgi:hypothetical protein
MAWTLVALALVVVFTVVVSRSGGRLDALFGEGIEQRIPASR